MASTDFKVTQTTIQEFHFSLGKIGTEFFAEPRNHVGLLASFRVVLKIPSNPQS